MPRSFPSKARAIASARPNSPRRHAADPRERACRVDHPSKFLRFFKVGNTLGSVNARYGTEPGATFYTHVSDQYAPFHVTLISATVRDATHVLDGLLYHE